MIKYISDALEEQSKLLSAIADYEIEDESLQSKLNKIAYNIYIIGKDLEEMVS